MKKRLFSILLALCMMLTMLPVTSFAASYVVGNNVTVPNSKVPADGTNPYCNCNNGNPVGSGTHWCCWNYGYNVYLNIWGVAPNRYDDSTHYLRNVDAADRTHTAEHLKEYLTNAAPGALLRIDKSSSPSAGDSDGHTLVFVKMNIAGDGAYFLEGNYDGHGRSRLHEWKFSQLASTYARYTYIKYISWPNAPEYSSNSLVRKTYPSYGKIKATADTIMMTLPCSNGTDAESVKVTDISKNATLTATALILNNQGNHWYKAKTSGGTVGYVPSSKMTWVETYTSDITISGKEEPADITVGNPYNIRGTVKSDYNEIAMVFSYVWQGTSVNTSTPIISTEDYVNGKSYGLSGSKIDNRLTFNTLAVGNYTWTISATYRNYYAIDEKTAGCHEDTVRLQTSNFNVVQSGHTHSWTLKYDGSNHWEACTSCSATRNTGSHSWYYTYDSSTHWYECYSCPAIRDEETHTWLKNYDNTYHWNECLNCDATKNKESHSLDIMNSQTHCWVGCENCNVVLEEEPHNWKTEYNSTHHWKECPSCNLTQNAAQHSWTREYDGSTHWDDCLYCDAVTNEVTHTWVDKYDGNYHWEECAPCGATRNKTSHAWHVVANSRTHWAYCEYCDATQSETEHNWVRGYSATGHSDYCSFCRVVKESSSAPHTMGSWVASPTNSGMERRSCRGCDYYEERATVTRPSLHNPEHTRSCALPTLSWDSVPGAVKYSVNIGSPPYDSIGWITTTGTNAVDVGAVLGKTYCYSVTAYNSEGDILSYSEGIWYEYKHTEVTDPGQNPTCGKDGYTASSYCSECNTVLTPSTPRPATGQHNFVGGSCVVCGKPDPNAATTITFADIPTDSWQYPFAQYAVENGLMAGKGTDENGNIKFDPNSPIKREEFVQVLYNAEGKPTVTIPNIFPDVAAGGWYKNAVLWAKQNDIASGKGNGNFGVGENISRQDLAMMLYKYAKLNGYSLNAVNGLVDAYADGAMVADYARGAMNWAVTNGIMSGKGAAGAPLSSVRLDPTGIATRAECAAMLKNFRTAFGG